MGVGVENYGDPLGQQTAISSIIHGPDCLTNDGEIKKARRMDSQVKYGVLARGGAEVFLRLPKAEYVEWIWDHAAGSKYNTLIIFYQCEIERSSLRSIFFLHETDVVLHEAGGKVTDAEGNKVDFSHGAKVPESLYGIIATNGGIFHEQILRAYKKQKVTRDNQANRDFRAKL